LPACWTERIFSAGGGAGTFLVTLAPPIPCAGDNKKLPKTD